MPGAITKIHTAVKYGTSMDKTISKDQVTFQGCQVYVDINSWHTVPFGCGNVGRMVQYDRVPKD